MDLNVSAAWVNASGLNGISDVLPNTYAMQRVAFALPFAFFLSYELG